jgi:hypothetical protein
VQWLILATWEVETGKIVVPNHLGLKVHKTPSQSIKTECKGACLLSQLLSLEADIEGSQSRTTQT